MIQNMKMHTPLYLYDNSSSYLNNLTGITRGHISDEELAHEHKINTMRKRDGKEKEIEFEVFINAYDKEYF